MRVSDDGVQSNNQHGSHLHVCDAKSRSTPHMNLHWKRTAQDSSISQLSSSMTSVFETSSAIQSRFRRRELSDSLVGPVLLHGASDRRFAEESSKVNAQEPAIYFNRPTSYRSPSNEQPTGDESSSVRREFDSLGARNALISPTTAFHKTLPAQTRAEASEPYIRAKPRKRQCKTDPRRLQQCRDNQNRYRERQKAFELQLQQSVDKLRNEVDSLRSRRQEVATRDQNVQSPWSVVADVFRLLETSFQSPWCTTNGEQDASYAQMKQIVKTLRPAFLQDVKLGHQSGAEALMQQVRAYSQNFGGPKLRLKRVEEIAPGVVCAVARLGVTVTEYSLRTVFPHLKKMPRSKYDTELPVEERLLGQRLDCSCSITFIFDEESRRVARVDVNIDWAAALVRVFGSWGDVFRVLDGASITSESILGEDTGTLTPSDN